MMDEIVSPRPWDGPELGSARAGGPLLVPESVLVIGPINQNRRTNSAVTSLRSSGGAVSAIDIDAAGGTDGLVSELRDLLPATFVCAVAYELTPSQVLDILPALADLETQLLVLSSSALDGLDDLVAVARATGIRVLGPGAYGPFSGGPRLFINPLHGTRETGFGVVTQSGNVVLDVVSALRTRADAAPRFAWGLGRSADIDIADAVAIAAVDPHCTAIGIHAEGFAGGRAVLHAVANAARRKPVLLLQGGTSRAGSASALSHTGGLATSRALVQGVFTQAGAHVVDRVDELATLGLALSMLDDGPCHSVVVVADGGGQGTLMVDALADHDVPVLPLSAATAARLEQTVANRTRLANPIDIDASGSAQPAVAFDVVAGLLDAEDVDVVVVVGVIGSYAHHFARPELEDAESKAAAKLAEQARAARKRVIFVSSYADDHVAAYAELMRLGVPVLRSIDDAASLMQALRRRHEFLRQAQDRSDFPAGSDAGASPALADDARPYALEESASRDVFRRHGIDLGDFDVASSSSAVADLCKPDREYVLKVVSPDIVHKSDVGGVRLRVDRGSATEQYEQLVSDVRRRRPDARILGVSVAPMAAPGVEVIIGGYRDPQFGPCIAFGSGGVLTELLGDAVLRAAPVTKLEAHEMIAGTRSARLLAGYRGSAPGNIESLAELIVRVSELIAEALEIQEIDLNPVIVSPREAQVVDARVVLR